MVRRLPDAEEAMRIIAARRTRPLPAPPPVAGKALRGALKAMEGRFGHGADALQAHWREIVGPELARRTEPTRLVRPRTGEAATLELRVAGPTAAIVQHRAEEIIGRANMVLGAGAVAGLRIVQGPLRGPTARKAERARPGPVRRLAGPLDAAAEQALAASLSGLPEGRLKAALTQLGREVMRSGRRDS
jgi:hypothetical protein